MSTESNKATLRRYYAEVFNKHDLSKWDEMMDKDYVMHAGTQDLRGLEGGKRTQASLLTSEPDVQVTIEGIVAEGDMVAVRGVFKGTNTGPIGNIPATGKKFTREYMAFYRFKNGKIIEGWRLQDGISMLRQLGITTIPQPAAQPTGAPAR